MTVAQGPAGAGGGSGKAIGGRARKGPMPATRSDQLKGMAIAFVGIVILSPDAMLTTAIDTDVATMTFWRGLGIALVMLGLSFVRHGTRMVSRFLATGLTGAVLVAALCATQVSFVAGLTWTSPSHVLVIVAASPLFGAIFSWLLLGERLRPVTAVAIAIAIGAIAITASGSLKGGGEAHWTGDLAALVVAVLLGLELTLIRSLRLSDAWTHFGVAALISALGAAIVFDLTPLTAAQVPLMAMLALFVMPVAFALITTAPRYITAPEVSLIMLLEAPFGTFLVWMVLGLAPTAEAMVGGAILLTTMVVHAVWVMRRPRAAPAPAAAPVSDSATG